MRGIPSSGVILFFLVIICIELLAYFGIRGLIPGKKQKRMITVFYWLITAVFLGTCVYAFANPEKIRETTNYDFFYFVISLSILNLVPKSIIVVFTVLSFPLQLLRDKFYSRLVKLSGLLLSFGVLLSIIYGISIGKKATQLNRVSIQFDQLPESLHNLRIIQLSDLHLGSFQNDNFLRQTAKRINDLEPDLILFTGDMVNNYYQEMLGFEDALAAMHAKYGKYAIWGNHDYGDYSNWKNDTAKVANHQRIGSLIREAGFDLLENESRKIAIRDTSFYMMGVENWGHKPFPQYAKLKKAMQGVPEQSFKVLMTHDPAHWEAEVIPTTSINLSLSGHTHGGQFGVKIGGLTFSPMYLVQYLWAGLYRSGNQFLYVNQGYGCVGFPGRIDMNPEITVLQLQSKSVNAD